MRTIFRLSGSKLTEGGFNSNKYCLQQNYYLIVVLLFSIVVFSCKDSSNNPDENTPEILKVKFVNNPESSYIITKVLVQPMGKADESMEPTGEWSENMLPAGVKLASGESTTFDLELPNLHWSRYRLGVEDGSGNEIMLHEQSGYSESDLPITHWGSDERTVSVTVVYSQSAGMIVVHGWSEFAGIDDGMQILLE